MGIESQLLQFLANLPKTDTVDERQGLFIITGPKHLWKHIKWEGSRHDFFTGLLRVFSRQEKTELLEFLDGLAKGPWIGAERKQPLADLRASIAALTPDQWRQAFAGSKVDVREIIKRCQEATGKEIEIVGRKYIRELYSPRRVEANFKRFLESDATCFLLVAKAGRGKTNLLCHIVDEWQAKRPILFLSGRKEPKDDMDFLRHIANRIGYGENWSACLNDLRDVAEVGSEPLILIDGINESAARPSVMQGALRELLVQAALHRIKVCVTCRTDFWQFYRAPFWGAYTWREDGAGSAGRVRGEDLPLFPEEDFGEIAARYFGRFDIQGELVEEAWERCRNPLLLRFFCEAYEHKDVGTVSQIRLYPLFRLFWLRKIGQAAELAGKLEEPVTEFVLTVARLMRQRHETRVPRKDIAREVGQDLQELMEPNSLYVRVLDEEIVLEHEVDKEIGTANVIFVYDKFSEFAIALSIFSDYGWGQKVGRDIVAEAGELMREESEYQFATLRGALEFLVLRIEDRRFAEGVHFDLIKAMLAQDWKWRRIGSMLAFQLTHSEEASFWGFMTTLIHNERDFVRRICAEQLGPLARYHAGRALPLLNQCLRDESDSVRRAAKESLLNLDAAAAIQEAQLLVNKQPLGAQSVPLAAEILLWPVNSRSPLLQEKMRWLVKENRNDDIQKVIFGYLANLELPPYKDLYALEELERAFQVGWKRDHQPGNPYLDVIQHHTAFRREALEVDLERLETLRTIVKRLFDFTVQTLGMHRTARSELGAALSLSILVPGPRDQKAFLRRIEQEFQVPLREWLYSSDDEISLGQLAVEIAHSAPVFATHPSTPHLVELPPQAYFHYDHETPRLIRLCQIADDLVKEAAILTEKSLSAITINTELGKGGLDLKPEERNALRTKAASRIGVELNAVEHRSLSSLGRLSLWLWRAELALEKEQQALEKKVREFSKLGTHELRQRLSVFQALTLSEQAKDELSLDLQAICRAYAASQPARAIEALTPLIIWHNENDSSALSQAFQTLHWRDQDSFWSVAEKLLEHNDQRIIDFASQVFEQAEYAEEQIVSGDVFDRVRGIIVDLLGVDLPQVTPDARFREDLECDSLDLVELIMSFEEEFDGVISDEDAIRIETVGEAVAYITTTMSTQGARNDSGSLPFRTLYNVDIVSPE